MFATRALRMQPSLRRMGPLPKETQSAHTVSQRLRTLKRTPPELIPLGVVLLVALGAAAYSSIHKFRTDKTLRLTRQGPEDR
ncbi:hypothetical protein FQN52_002993 [Onygenales sp. PD_12]|nr:hypothetical protein FQN52_002993 [Onygenales sp. PD_12]KAK2790310.1 hypothetical protein FQN53_000076 [Emmonsiellopsis sp. PD_33]KAK2806580.1 hypothetical protein FQN51_006546 [Onygenales sp. PD_10]